MPGNDAVLFFSETHVVEVKGIIMSGVFLADVVGSFAGWLSKSCAQGPREPGSTGASVNTPSLGAPSWGVAGSARRTWHPNLPEPPLASALP